MTIMMIITKKDSLIHPYMINNMLPKLKPLGLSGVLVERPLVDSTVLIVFVSVVEVGCFPGQAYLEWKIVS